MESRDVGEEYRFEPELARASTPPSSWYRDAAILAREQERVFARTWQLVARSGDLAATGDWVTAAIAGEPLLLVRGEDGAVAALSNVCRHRAGPVAAGSGRAAKRFRCGYHGWTYGIDGGLVATPDFDGVEGFDRTGCTLPRFRAAEWAGLVFACLDADVPPLLEWLGDLPQKLAHVHFGDFQPAARKDWTLDANWKVYVDNYLEGYHIPIVHPRLFRELDYTRYAVETRGAYSIQHAPIKRPGGPMRGAPGEEAEYFWIYPNLMLNVYPDNYSTNVILPLGPERTLTAFEWFFRDPESEASKAAIAETVAFSDEVQLEDIAICETVQRNLRSRTYTSGRYSVKRENGVHHFHGMLSAALSSGCVRE